MTFPTFLSDVKGKREAGLLYLKGIPAKPTVGYIKSGKCFQNSQRDKNKGVASDRDADTKKHSNVVC